MAGFDDLLESCQPRLCDVIAAATEGATWKWELKDVTDSSGAPIDLSTGYTAECKILTDVSGTAIITLTVALGNGTITVSATPANTAGLVSGSAPVQGVWYCFIVRTSDSAKAQLWGPSDSPFTIESA